MFKASDPLNSARSKLFEVLSTSCKNEGAGESR